MELGIKSFVVGSTSIEINNIDNQNIGVISIKNKKYFTYPVKCHWNYMGANIYTFLLNLHYSTFIKKFGYFNNLNNFLQSDFDTNLFLKNLLQEIKIEILKIKNENENKN